MAASFKQHIESLDTRILFNSIKGTQSADVIRVGNSSGPEGFYIEINGVRRPGVTTAAIDALAGDDVFIVEPNFRYHLVVYGGAGNDSMIGGAKGDTLFGQEGDDTIIGMGGGDAISGGAGNDSIDGGASDDVIHGDGANFGTYADETTAAGSDTIFAGVGGDQLFGDGGNDSLDGGDDNDYLLGGAGNDIANGGDGDDTLLVGREVNFVTDEQSNDVLDGGAGRNKLFVDSSLPYRVSADGKANDGIAGETTNVRNVTGFTMRIAAGSVVDARGAADYCTFEVQPAVGQQDDIGEPILIYGSQFGDQINYVSTSPFAQPFAISAGAGNDVVFGGLGKDRIDGGDGKDTLYGLEGNDTLQGGAGSDYLDGAGGKDALYGNGSADTLAGGNGNDRLFGGPNDADFVSGGAGTDSAADDDKDTFTLVENLIA